MMRSQNSKLYFYIYILYLPHCKKEFVFDIYHKMGAHVTNCVENKKERDRRLNATKQIKYHLICLKCNSEYYIQTTDLVNIQNIIVVNVQIQEFLMNKDEQLY